MAKKRARTDFELPDFMQADAGRGLENIGPDDVVWIGEDGELDVDAVLNSSATPASSLKRLILAIIEAHPSDVEGAAERRAAHLHRLEVAVCVIDPH